MSDVVADWQSLVEQTSDLITVIDAAGTIRYENPATERILGFAPGERVGESAFDFIHPEDRDQAVESFSAAVESDQLTTGRVEFRYQDADGDWVWLESIGNNRPNSGVDGFVIVSRDVTQRKEYERQLESLSTELDTLNRILRHDIRNDMAVILGWGEMLYEHVDEQGTPILDRMLTSGEHIVELTTIARDYAKTLGREGQITPEPVRVQPVLRDEVARREEAYPHATFVEIDEIPDVTVFADELLASVFQNLLNNAVQHNDKDEPIVELSCERTDDEITITIADNGPGIPDAAKEGIFGEYEKGLASAGTGLGLYLVDQLVTGYGGDVTVADNDPEGALFAVTLPLAE